MYTSSLTNMDKATLIVGLSDALRVEINNANNQDDRIYALNYRLRIEAELLRRLNELEELRKENALLRGDNAELLAMLDAQAFSKTGNQ